MMNLRLFNLGREADYTINGQINKVVRFPILNIERIRRRVFRVYNIGMAVLLITRTLYYFYSRLRKKNRNGKGFRERNESIITPFYHPYFRNGRIKYR